MSRETVILRIGNSLAVRWEGDCAWSRGVRVRERRKGGIIMEPLVDA